MRTVLLLVGAMAILVCASQDNTINFQNVKSLHFTVNRVTSQNKPQVVTNSYWNQDVICENLTYQKSTEPVWNCKAGYQELRRGVEIKCPNKNDIKSCYVEFDTFNFASFSNFFALSLFTGVACGTITAVVKVVKKTCKKSKNTNVKQVNINQHEVPAVQQVNVPECDGIPHSHFSTSEPELPSIITPTIENDVLKLSAKKIV
jgi:hypothetical protein